MSNLLLNVCSFSTDMLVGSREKCVCVPQLYSELTPLHASLNRDDALSVYKMTAFQVALICVFTVLVIFFIFGILHCVFSLPPSLPPSISLFPSSFSRTDL